MSDLSAWPALVLTAGLATRLRPLSLVRAKAAMPVAGVPLIARVLRWLRASGVRRVVLNLHHRPETITGIVGDGAAWDLEVRYSWEPALLGSAGGPRRALDLIASDRFLIINGDTITNCDLGQLVEHHLGSRAQVTMAVAGGDVDRYGGALVDGARHVVGFRRARTPPSGPDACRLFIGVQAAESAIFARLDPDEPSETVRTLYPALIARRAGSVAAYESDAEFFDIGTARDYLATVSTIAAREGAPFDRGDGTLVDPSASVSQSILWDRVTVGAAVLLTNCIVSDGVHVPTGGHFENRVLVADGRGFADHPL
jgi:mannose-1-phosphate guanylyltransferase